MYVLVMSGWSPVSADASKLERELARELPVGHVLKTMKVRVVANLARYLGGEVQPLAYDAQGRPTRQLERMVLAQDDLATLFGPVARTVAPWQTSAR